MRRLALVLPFVVALVACTSSSGGNDDAGCWEREERVYPRLEQVADDALIGVDHTLVRVSGCESTGQANAQVAARVLVWQSRTAAVRYLRVLGWSRDPTRSTMTSPDRGFFAQPILADDGDGRRYIELRLGRTSDR